MLSMALRWNVEFLLLMSPSVNAMMSFLLAEELNTVLLWML